MSEKEARKYVAIPQKGAPGHCYAAQVFKDGKAFLTLEPTQDEMEATRNANHIANCLNRVEVNRLQAENKLLREALQGIVNTPYIRSGCYPAFEIAKATLKGESLEK